jgi:hypothetical protein
VKGNEVRDAGPAALTPRDAYQGGSVYAGNHIPGPTPLRTFFERLGRRLFVLGDVYALCTHAGNVYLFRHILYICR